MNDNTKRAATPREGSCPESCSAFRIGLPILPVRYAVVDAESCLPALHATFADPSLPGLEKAARYGLRLLRRGFLYVYNENYRILEGYLVTRKGTLSRLSFGNPLPKDQEATFNCQWEEHWGAAACFTVPNAQLATKKIWVCFSDVEWTAATRDAHSDSGETGAALRRRHMVSINVQEWLATQRHAHAAPVDAIDAHVAEFAVGGMAPSAVNRAFEWSVVPPLERAGTLSSYVKAAAHRLAPGKGLMLALPDPVGVAQDLNALIKYKMARFMAEDEREWKLETSVAIKGVREAYARHAEKQLERRQLANAEIAAVNISAGTLAGPLSDIDQASREAMHAAKNLPEPVIEAARRDAWLRYLDDYDEQARADFDAQFRRDLEALEDGALKSLSSALAAWFRHEQTRASFQCNFDPRSIDNGEHYVAVAWSMVCGVAGCGAVGDEVLHQMEAEFTDKDAIFKRALLLNSDIAADRVSAAAAGNVDMSNAKFWKQSADLFLDAYTGGLKPARLNVIRDVVAKLLFELSAALVRVLSNAAIVMQPQRQRIMAMLEWLTGKKIVALQFKGTPRQLERFLVNQLRERSPQLALGEAKRTARRTIDESLGAGSGSRIPAGKQPTDQYFEWFFFLDEDVARTMNSAGPSGHTPAKMRESALSMEQLDQLVQKQYRQYLFDPIHAQTGNFAMRVGVVALILEGLSMVQLLRSSDVSMEKSPVLSSVTVSGAVAGLLGTSADLLSKSMERRVSQAMQLGAETGGVSRIVGLSASTMGKVGRWLGLGGNLIGMGTDFYKAWDAGKKGKIALTLYFAASGTVNLVVAILLAIGTASCGVAILVALGLAALGFVIQKVVELFCRNDLEDWLGKTVFGLAAARYGSLEEQSLAMGLLIGEK